MKKPARPTAAKTEKPAPAQKSAPLLILISAPSGGGKTTLCNLLLEARPEMTRAITCTTRDPRPGEQDGVDYYFLEPDNFLKRVQAGNFLEHATVYGHSYGLLRSELLGKLRDGRGCPGRRHHQGARARGPGFAPGAGVRLSDPALAENPRGALA